jgi:RNA polymerase sigma-70 factor (ECF subfamily)
VHLDLHQALDAFLSREEKPAYRKAQISTRSREDALDIIQDAMMKFVEKYRHTEQTMWRPLFYRVVNSRIVDWHRRRRVRSVVSHLFGEQESLDDFSSPVPDPAQTTKQTAAIAELESALTDLPLRQQQAVLHRLWDGMSTEQTAIAMGVSSGSVKTHYSRGLKMLQQRLGDHWP